MKNKEDIKIAIKFGDNDFGGTFRGVLEMLYSAYIYTGLPADKEKLCWLINNLSPLAYVTHQNQWSYNGLEKGSISDTLTNEEFEHIKKCLQITPDKIMLNEEVDKYIEEGDKVHCFNSETFVLDTTIRVSMESDTLIDNYTNIYSL